MPTLPEHAAWLQGGPYGAKDFKGHVSCLFFFGYANIGSIRTFAFFKHLARYKDLQRIGVHVPEYPFEHDQSHVRAALQHYGLENPVLLDHGFEACALFNNQWLPRMIVIGADGGILYDHIGEGGHVEIETAIQQALLSLGATNLPTIPSEPSLGGGLCYRTTPDIALGYVHGSFLAKEEIIPFEEVVYTQTDKVPKEQVAGVHGHWKLEKEYIEHTKTLPIASEHIAFLYSAFSVSLVAEPLRHGLTLFVDLDGKPLPEDLAGEDISYTKEGQSVVALDMPRLYRLIDGDTYHRGHLKIRVKEADIRLYGMIFGDCRNV